MLEMSTSADSSDEEQTKECSGSIFQEAEEDAAGAAAAPTTDGLEFESFRDTTLQDLPMELIEYILIKVVAIEVKSMKLSKSVWKEKADPVINRLRTVCSKWNSILTTDFFRNELNRTLDRTGQETIRMEILHQYAIQLAVFKVTTLRDEIFLLCSSLDGSEVVINVYDRNNMKEEKDVIHLPRISPADVAACIVSNCVYILDNERYCPSVLRITRDGKNHFKVSPWIYDLRLTASNRRGPMFVSANGSLVILTRPGRTMLRLDRNEYYSASAGIHVYNVNGSLLLQIMLSPDIYGFTEVNNVIQKADGNFVLNSANDDGKTRLLEIDATGKIVRQYQSPLSACSVAGFADIHGRLMINVLSCSRMEFLDREFNPVEMADPRVIEDDLYYSPSDIHFNMERNEIVRVESGMHQTTALSIYRLTEE